MAKSMQNSSAFKKLYLLYSFLYRLTWKGVEWQFRDSILNLFHILLKRVEEMFSLKRNLKRI